MEDHLRRNLHSPLSDPDSFHASTTVFTGSNSGSSVITVDASKHSLLRPSLDLSTKWTDQQHNLYLDSLEASFVNEFHRSLGLCGLRLQNNSKKAYKSITFQNSLNTSRQFMILQDDCWKKVNLERNEHVLESTADSDSLARIPLGHHLSSVKRGYAMRESDIHHHGLLCNEGIHLNCSSTLRSSKKQSCCHSCHLELVGSTAEVTDQNFKEEDHEATSNCRPMVKRLKTAVVDASNNHQIVPFEKFLTTGASTITSPSSENKGQNELLSELPESFHFQKSDLLYFLRES